MTVTHYCQAIDKPWRKDFTLCGKVAERCASVTSVKNWVTCASCNKLLQKQRKGNEQEKRLG
jgi:hypothetical protein